MSYVDQKPKSNQRAIAAVVVALLQGAAVIAVINGFAVHFIPKEPLQRLAAQQWKLPPPPPPEKPKVEPDRKPTVLTAPKPPIEVLPVDGPVVFELPPIDLPETEITTIAHVDPPVPGPSFTPHRARPLNGPETWFTTSDYPSRDLREGNQGTARFSLTIGTDGRVQACTITQSTGFRGLDEVTCNLATRRAHFKPATDSTGMRVTGTYSGSVKWVIPGD